MNLTDPNYLKTFFKQHGFKPRDYLGQNFLVDEEALQGIVDAAEVKSTDMILEVGPGLGVLTFELVKKAKKVFAVEKDQRLSELLSKTKSNPALQIVTQDILEFHLDKYITSDYKVVANIPYYLTSKLLQHFLEIKHQPTLMVLMVQKEVGERVVAKAGELSVLGISVQVYADAEIVREVPKESFWPQPEVDSVILKITPRNKYAQITDRKLFFRIVKAAFAGKRKQIHNTLATGFGLSKEETTQWLKDAGVEPMTRPQDIAIDQWVKLYGSLQSRSSVL